MIIPGQKATVADILQYQLPDGKRQEFKQWSSEVNSEDFFKLLPSYFTPDEISGALAEYVTERLTELELFVGCRIDAVLNVNGVEFAYKSYNEVAHV